MKKCIFVRGLPGSGKSTFAEFLASTNTNSVIVEADKIAFENYGEWKQSLVSQYHKDAFKLFCESVDNSVELIIVSNVNSSWIHFKEMYYYAEDNGYHVTSLITENRHESGSIHNVNESTYDGMRNKFSVVL